MDALAAASAFRSNAAAAALGPTQEENKSPTAQRPPPPPYAPPPPSDVSDARAEDLRGNSNAPTFTSQNPAPAPAGRPASDRLLPDVDEGLERLSAELANMVDNDQGPEAHAQLPADPWMMDQWGQPRWGRHRLDQQGWQWPANPWQTMGNMSHVQGMDPHGYGWPGSSGAMPRQRAAPRPRDAVARGQPVKTEMCIRFSRGGCRKATCRFAHGEEELVRPDQVPVHLQHMPAGQQQAMPAGQQV